MGDLITIPPIKALKPPAGTPVNMAHPLAQCLLGCWPFYEGIGGIVSDATPYAHHGIMPTSGAAWVSSSKGRVVDADGGAGNVIDTGWRWDIGANQDFSCSTWYKGTEVTSYAGLVGAAIFGVDGFLLGLQGSGAVMESYCWIDGSGYSAPDIQINDDIWHHIAFTRMGNTGTWYVDNVLDATTTVVTNSLNVAQNVMLFGWGHDTYNTEGMMDITMFWDRALSPDEITKLYVEPYCVLEQSGIFVDEEAVAGVSIPVVVHHLRQQGIS